MTRVLLVEDNADFAYGLRNNLEIEGYAVAVVGNGLVAHRIIEDETFDLVILDLMVPDMNGIEILAHIRKGGSDVPVVVVTALHEEQFWLRALNIGADLYVPKPLPSLLGFLAQLKALLRRGSRLAMPPEDVAAALEEYGTAVPQDPTGGQGWYVGGRFISRVVRHRDGDDSVVALTPKEHELLLYLLGRARRVVPKDELLRAVWGYEPRMGIKKTGVLKDTIYRLRSKLEEDPSNPRHIKRVGRKGYCFEP